MTGRPLIVQCEGPTQGQFDPDRSTNHQVTIHFATLNELRPHSEEFASLLDVGENERLVRFRFDKDKERFLLGHGALRVILADAMSMDARTIRFDRGPYGKPTVAGTDLHFNLSDTKDAIAIAVGSTGELGVDLETTSRTVDHVAVGEHYFTAEERSSIHEALDGKRRFLEFWTRKEAVLKASGVGIMDDLHILRVDRPVNRMMITHSAFKAMAADVYHVRTWNIDEQHIISLATARDSGVVRFQRITH